MRLFVVLLAIKLLTACSFTETQIASDKPLKSAYEIVTELDVGPGNITVLPKGEIIVSLHQFYGHEDRVVSISADGSVNPFAEQADLNSVLGLQADSAGVVWLLDNAMRGGETRRLVGWDVEKQTVSYDIDLSPVTTQQSFLNDLAVDRSNQAIYIADPAGGEDAAIIVVDLVTGVSRRLLQGHKSVVPEDVALNIDEKPVRILQENGEYLYPRIGINPIALDHNNEWLYYGPMHGLSLYRVRTADLRAENLSLAVLAEKVERWSDKPICDGISIDATGNIYLGDLANNAIGVIGTDRHYNILFSDPELSWVDAFSYGNDGKLYAVVNQLHRSAVLNGGESAVLPPYHIISFDPLADGTVRR